MNTDEPLEMKIKRFNIRELIMLQKITAAWDSTDMSHGRHVYRGRGRRQSMSLSEALVVNRVLPE